MRNSSRGRCRSLHRDGRWWRRPAPAEARGRDIVHMENRPKPGTPAPAAARAGPCAGRCRPGPLGYTVALGLPELRGAHRPALRRMVRAGSRSGPGRGDGGLLGRLPAGVHRLFFDAGQRVGIGAPGYPSYRQILRALSLGPVVIETRPPPTATSRCGRSSRSRGLDGLLVASPGNPSGTMLGRAALGALMGWPRRPAPVFISDEIYHGIEYEAKAVSALELSDEVCVINSFSKYFSMTGWRVGWMVVPSAEGPQDRAGWPRTSSSARPMRARWPRSPRLDAGEEAAGQPRRLRGGPQPHARGAPARGVHAHRAARWRLLPSTPMSRH